jgi:hypothetical protein
MSDIKKHLIFILTIISMTFCSWTISKTNLLNADSWGITIGKKEILGSWKNNEMGDIAMLDKKKLKLSDTLFVKRYLCGYSGQNAITTVTIKNSQNEIIKVSVNKDNKWMFTAKMPISDILNSPKIKDNQILSVYFNIDSKTKEINQTVLLGRLKFK